jgi:hypothetical protein
MKTTLELPDELFLEAKATAAKRRTTLKNLFIRALERELHREKSQGEADFFEIDEEGWPVLRRPASDETVVTEEFLNNLRELEGV